MGNVSPDDGVVFGPYRSIRYEDPSDGFRPYDSRFPAVASDVIALIQERLPDAVVEHVGSSAIPECAGKGVVDLMVLYEPGGLEMSRQVLEEMGLRRHTGPKAHPIERPVLIGAIDHDGEPFRLHVHVIPEESPEVADQLHFRDVLRAHPDLVAEYVAVKRGALAQGVSDSHAYNDLKDPFIKRVMALGR